MNNIQKTTVCITAFLLVFSQKGLSALSTYGTWAATTISADETVTLTGNVELTGTITVSAGKTLTINTDGNNPYSITRMSNYEMFLVKGILIINGAEGKQITLDGNYNDGVSPSYNGYGIEAQVAGNVQLQYVTIDDIYFSNSSNSGGQGAAIFFSGSAQTAAAGLTMDHVTVKNCKRVNINTTGNTSAIMLFTGNTTAANMYSISLTNCTFQNNSSANYSATSGGVIRNFNADQKISCSIVSCTFSGNTIVKTGTTPNGIGAAVTWSNANPITITDCIMTGNSAAKGGALYFASSVTTDSYVSGGTYSNNTATEGGAIYSEGACSIKSNCTVSNNTATSAGGGIYLNGSVSPNLSGITISGNGAVNGGGVYCNSAAPAFNGCTVSENTATNGGGIYIYKNVSTSKTITLASDVNITGNNAADGAGLYIASNNATNVYTVNSEASISSNVATGNGGGLYFGGAQTGINYCMLGGIVSNNSAVNGAGIYSNRGETFNLSAGSIQDNTATGNGGGIYLTGGTQTISGGTISGNKAIDGAGIYFTGCTPTFTGAVISDNTATGNGGGIYNANGLMTFNASSSYANIVNNTAINGGGIYISNYGRATLNAALVTENIATGSGSIQTAYESNTTHAGTDIQGAGGGIYLNKGTSSNYSTLTLSGSLCQVFNNTASNIADDILADGLYTTLITNDIANRNTIDGSGTVNGWFEDFISGDTKYSESKTTKTGTSAERYKKTIQDGGNPSSAIQAGTYTNKYVSLRVGLKVKFTVSKNGLKQGESSFFKLYRNDSSIGTFVVTCNNTGSPATTTIALNGTTEGKWKIVEVPSWSWQLDHTPDTHSVEKECFGVFSETFAFGGTEKDDIPAYAESNSNNIFTPKNIRATIISVSPRTTVYVDAIGF